MRKPQLTVTFAETGQPVRTTIEIYLLNPGERFPRFGGSRHDLVVGKTASLVERTITGGMCSDVERDVFDPVFWSWMERIINRDGFDGIDIRASASPASPSNLTPKKSGDSDA